MSALPSVNDLFRDSLLRRAVGIVYYSNGLVRKVMSLLNKADADLFDKLETALERGASQIRIDHLQAQLDSVRSTNAAIYARVAEGLTADLSELSADELAFQGKLFTIIPPVALPYNAVSPATLYAATMARPFQGKLLKTWARELGAAKTKRVSDAVKLGVLQNEPIADIVRRVRGTKAKGYADGLIQIDRRHAEAVVRTAVSHTVSVARENVYSANSDLVKAVQWLSTLDDRTSPICAVRDGLQYTCETHIGIGHDFAWMGGPGQAHWNCRSCSTPVLKSMAELGIALPDFPKTGSRASMDGQVPKDTTYAEWFAKQSAARQDAIVGSSRGRLFRAGKVSFDGFVNDKGQWLSLAELQATTH